MSNHGHGLSPEIIEQLKEPMELSRVKTRKAPGGGVVPYIDGADAISTANRIFSFDWSSNVGEIRFQQAEERSEVRWNPETQKREATGEKKQAGIYYVTVSVSACGITKGDVGRCICDGNAVEAHDMAIAGAVTDGLKRALRQFGDQFGNALYDKESDTFREAMQGQQPAWGSRSATARPTPQATQPAASATRTAAQPATAGPATSARPAPAQRPAAAPSTSGGHGERVEGQRPERAAASRPDGVEAQPSSTQPARPAAPNPRPTPSTTPPGSTNRVRPAPGRPVEQIIPNPRRSNPQLPLDD